MVGQVVDQLGRPISGAALALHVNSGSSARTWSEKGPQWTTDEQGRYDLRGVPSRTLDGRRTTLHVIVMKEGFAVAATP